MRREDGVVLLVALMSMMLMAALGSALILTTMTETGVAATYADGVEAFYAADAGVERTLAELRDIADWTTARGTRFDGPADALTFASTTGPQIRVVVSVSAAALAGAVIVRAQASTARGVERTIEATVVQTNEPGSPGFRLLAWRDVR